MDSMPFPIPVIDGGTKDESLASPQRRRYLASLVADQAGHSRVITPPMAADLIRGSGPSCD